jgi:hypothetical protein
MLHRVVVVTLTELPSSAEAQEELERQLWEQFCNKPLVVLPAGSYVMTLELELPDRKIGPLTVVKRGDTPKA